MEAKGVFSMVSRESGLVANNLLLAVSTFVVFIGTIWPLMAEMFFDRTLSVGPPFFDMAFTPFMVALAAVILPDRRDAAVETRALGRRCSALVPALVLALALGSWPGRCRPAHPLAPIGIALSVWLVAGAAPTSGRAPGAGVGIGTAPPAAAPAARRLGQGGGPCGARHHHVRGGRADRLGGRGYPRRPDRRPSGRRLRDR
jgi:cytochrome c-type biogenesis protein CcmF